MVAIKTLSVKFYLCKYGTICEHVDVYSVHILVFSICQEVILVDLSWEDIDNVGNADKSSDVFVEMCALKG
jgi:hypothetical protein